MYLIKILLGLALLGTPALALEDNVTKLGLAREAINAMQVDKMFESMGVQLKQMVLQQTPIPADATPEQRKQFDELIGKVMDLSMSEAKGLMQKVDVIYAEVYSEAELRAMVAFFNSAEGKSMLEKQPKIMAGMMPLVEEMQQKLMPKVKKLVDEAKADMSKPQAK